ncbi:hypothetical protein llap_7516 [Limosa lapponica baueri]|uniref:Uncharacterized protein n=1 Tax=Limosa lapponica baueri TaxID=1758121 RepID=A0A2I0U829_LIMLA|nr:hypothetical protein llap_7516 [Limosa lapponica baueri]
MALTQGYCLCFGYAGGMFDHIMEKMLPTPETEASCRPPEQFRWSTAFSLLIPEKVNAMRMKKVTQASNISQVNEWEHEGDAITGKEFMQWGCWATRHKPVVEFCGQSTNMRKWEAQIQVSLQHEVHIHRYSLKEHALLIRPKVFLGDKPSLLELGPSIDLGMEGSRDQEESSRNISWKRQVLTSLGGIIPKLYNVGHARTTDSVWP